MEEKDKELIAKALALTMPISKYETEADWYNDFKKIYRKLRKTN